MLNYHNERGEYQYLVPPALETEFYKEFPSNATPDQHIVARGKWLTRASEVVYDYLVDQLTPKKPRRDSGDILYQIFTDYIFQGFMPEDFILAAWDLVSRCQCERIFADRQRARPMSSKKTNDLPKVEMRKALSTAMDGMNPLVVKSLSVAGPEYMQLRAAEAFAAQEYELALVLLAWSQANKHVTAIPGDAPPAN